MRLYSHSLSLFPSIICLLPTFITALTIDCKNIRVDKKSFNLKALDGPHTVGWVDVQPQSTTSYAFTIDLCKSLKKVDDGCPNGARGKFAQRGGYSVSLATLALTLHRNYFELRFNS